jgi:branched-chain amino acid transport system permease protein
VAFLLGVDLYTFFLDLAAFFGIYLLIALSLNLELGYLGIPDFGKGLFVAVGGLITGSYVDRLVPWMLNLNGGVGPNSGGMALQGTAILQHNIPLSLAIFLSSLVIAGTAGGIVGYVISYPVIRLKGHYLGIFLFIMAFFFLSFSNTYTPLVNGTYGLSVPDPFGWALGNRFAAVTAVIMLIALGGYFAVNRITNSPYGRLLRAIREDETAATSFGKDIVRSKISIMVLASAIAAIAGCLYTFYTLAALPETYTLLTWTVLPWLMVIVGGSGNNRGVALGVFLILIIQKIVSGFQYLLAPYVPFEVAWTEYLVIPLLLAAVLLIRPDGVLRELNIHLTKMKSLGLNKAKAGTDAADYSGTEEQRKP